MIDAVCFPYLKIMVLSVVKRIMKPKKYKSIQFRTVFTLRIRKSDVIH